MDNVKICYSIRNNIGDAINPYIVERVLGYNPCYADEYHCEITGIGSGLWRFFYSPSETSLCSKLLFETKKYNLNPLILWSAGFIKTPIGNERKKRVTTIPAAVRGELSLAAIKKVLNVDCKDCVTGDAGILASEIVNEKIEKKYSLGIIPHDSERNEDKYKVIQSNIKNSVIIDVRDDVLHCLSKIAQCECIISSSLHGLVIADGFHIPNRRVILTDKLAGDGFKFRDYYSSYGLSPKPLNINVTDQITMYDITDCYKVDSSIVENKKKLLSAAFSRFLE